MTLIIWIIAYFLGALSGVVFTSLIVAGKKMDEVMKMDGEEHEE